MDAVRYGIAGFGGIAQARLAMEGFALDRARFSENPNAVLVAVTDTDSSKRSAAQTLGLDFCPSIEELLGRADIDAVVIATNNASHFSIAKLALSAGKHVFVEKPLATRSDDARELRRLASERQLSLGVDHMMTNNAFHVEAAGLIASGAIGDVEGICLHMEFLYGSTPSVHQW
jgi:predicted dehydrogenase